MEQEIISKYLNGISISELNRQYPNISYRKIRQILIENNITIRGGRKKKTLSEEQFNEFNQKFQDGVTYDELSKIYHLDKETLRNIAKEHQLKRRNNNRINKRILSDYFSIINTKEKAYWLGFLFTDGCVDGEKRIRLQLQEQDKEILERFKEDLQIDSKIIYDKRSNSICCSVEFTDQQIFNDLGKYGIVPKKTYKSYHLPLDNIPEEFISSFLLGAFDGDGSLSYSIDCSTDVSINFTSYYESMVEDFQFAIDKLIDKKEHNKNFFTSAWHTQWRGRLQCLKILDILYNNCPRHLERKYQKYLKLKNSLN